MNRLHNRIDIGQAVSPHLRQCAANLVLIQRRVDDPQEVSRLARAEERALRSWLYGPAGPSGMLASTLADMVAQTEADYDDRIELVTVGDAVVDDRVAGLVAATREAVRNAATT